MPAVGSQMPDKKSDATRTMQENAGFCSQASLDMMRLVRLNDSKGIVTYLSKGRQQTRWTIGEQEYCNSQALHLIAETQKIVAASI